MQTTSNPTSTTSGGCECAAPAPTSSLFTQQVSELVAIGAAIAAHCEPCLRYHTRLAEQIGVSRADMAAAVRVAESVKATPHRNILSLAARLMQGDTAAEPAAGSCCSAG